MEAVILTKDQYQTILDNLNSINTRLEKVTKPSSETFVDNQEFIIMMKISKRTAQSWRDEGKISFSQVGGKIYYKLSDVETLLQLHYNKSFARK